MEYCWYELNECVLKLQKVILLRDTKARVGEIESNRHMDV